jgi:5-oxoprolinase (ATP-hydrolysing) subunit A
VKAALKCEKVQGRDTLLRVRNRKPNEDAGHRIPTGSGPYRGLRIEDRVKCSTRSSIFYPQSSSKRRTMRRIDINCDLGESFGIYKLGQDEKIYPLITSANIACGFHAGDPQVMRASVARAVQYQVAVGAHPGTPDLLGFGRHGMELSQEEFKNAVIYQIGALEAFARAHHTHLSHVKLHGWLYNTAAKDFDLALTIAQAVKAVSPQLVLFGLAGSQMIQAAKQAGLPHAQEAFMDRTYQCDGTLTSRSSEKALICDPERAAQQAVSIVLEGRVRAVDGTPVEVRADTLCVHGDNPNAVSVLTEARKRLLENGVKILPFGSSDS